MKRKTMIMTAAMLLVLGSAVVLNGQEAQAAKKQKVKAVVKGSTLTVSGKGAMPSSLKVKKSQRNKVKKIVVKKGITAIPVDAFRKYKNVTKATVATSVKTIGANAFRCPKLKKLTVPGDFKVQFSGGYWVTDKVDTVAFNTKLNLENAASFDANNLVVKKSDPNYKSVGGVIYTKDGKEIVRVPFQRGEVVIEEGCEVFSLQSVMYANEKNIDEDPLGGCRVRKIVIPASVKQVESEKHFALNQRGLEKRIVNREITGLQVDIRTRQLDDRSLSELAFVLSMGVDNLMKLLPDRITLSDGMYFADKNVLLGYKGEEGKVTVPEGTAKIGAYAFRNTFCLDELVLPEGMVEIGKEAFKRAFRGTNGEPTGERVTFPSTLKVIGEEAFCENQLDQIKLPDSVEVCGKRAFCMAGLRDEIKLSGSLKVVSEEMLQSNSLTKIVIPDSVEKIEREAFTGNMIYEIQLGKNIREIEEKAFMGAYYKHLTVPASVVKIGPMAFGKWDDNEADVLIQGDSKGISGQAFSKECVLTYSKSPAEQKVSLQFNTRKIYPLKKAVMNVWWTSVKEADGYEIMAATNAKFTKNKKKLTADADETKKTVTVKGKIKKNAKIYVRVRPYIYLDGAKVYGRWSVLS